MLAILSVTALTYVYMNQSSTKFHCRVVWLSSRKIQLENVHSLLSHGVGNSLNSLIKEWETQLSDTKGSLDVGATFLLKMSAFQV